MGLYNTYSTKFSLVSQESKTFTNPVPINDLDNADNYNHITTTQNFEYDSYVGLPTKITNSTSNSDKILETKNYYVDQVSQLSGLTTSQTNACSTLETMHILTNLVQSETYQTEGINSPELLTTLRTLYKNWNGGGLVLPEFIQTAKENNSLENRIRFYEYTIYGNPLEVSKENGSRIRYVYNGLSLPIRKIENYNPASNQSAFGGNLINTPCYYQNEHPDSFVTKYNYRTDTNLIESIEDPRCRVIYYHYDEFNRLKYVKDHDGNLLESNEYNFKLF